MPVPQLAEALYEAHRHESPVSLNVNAEGRESQLLLDGGNLVGAEFRSGHRSLPQSLLRAGLIDPAKLDALWAEGQGAGPAAIEALGLQWTQACEVHTLSQIERLSEKATHVHFEAGKVSSAFTRIPGERVVRAAWLGSDQGGAEEGVFRCIDAQKCERWLLSEAERQFILGFQSFKSAADATPARRALLELLSREGAVERMRAPDPVPTPEPEATASEVSWAALLDDDPPVVSIFPMDKRPPGVSNVPIDGRPKVVSIHRSDNRAPGLSMVPTDDRPKVVSINRIDGRPPAVSIVSINRIDSRPPAVSMVPIEGRAPVLSMAPIDGRPPAVSNAPIDSRPPVVSSVPMGNHRPVSTISIDDDHTPIVPIVPIVADRHTRPPKLAEPKVEAPRAVWVEIAKRASPVGEIRSTEPAPSAVKTKETVTELEQALRRASAALAEDDHPNLGIAGEVAIEEEMSVAIGPLLGASADSEAFSENEENVADDPSNPDQAARERRQRLLRRAVENIGGLGARPAESPRLAMENSGGEPAPAPPSAAA